MSRYYDKSIKWSDTIDFIANFENVFVSWDKILEGTIQNNFAKSRKYLSSSILVKPLSFQFAVIFLLILKLKILQNLTMILWIFISGAQLGGGGVGNPSLPFFEN